MTHAAPEIHPGDRHLEAVRPILELRSGLPISLSVAGGATSLSMNSGLDFDFAYWMYFKEISDEMA